MKIEKERDIQRGTDREKHRGKRTGGGGIGERGYKRERTLKGRGERKRKLGKKDMKLERNRKVGENARRGRWEEDRGIDRWEKDRGIDRWEEDRGIDRADQYGRERIIVSRLPDCYTKPYKFGQIVPYEFANKKVDVLKSPELGHFLLLFFLTLHNFC